MNRTLLNLIALYNRLKLGEHPLGILYFHRVLEKSDPYFSDDPSRDEFIQLIKFLKKHFNLLPLDEAIKQKERGTLQPLSLCLTFDDGFKDNHDIALPILEDFGVKAAFFVASQGIDEGALWNGKLTHAIRHTNKHSLSLDTIQIDLSLKSESDRVKASNQLIGKAKFSANSLRNAITDEVISLLDAGPTPREMLREDEIKRLNHFGHLIGAHTHSHSILGFQDSDIARDEISKSGKILSALLNQQIEHFAFPNGLSGRDFKPEHLEMLQTLGFKYGYSTNDGGYTIKTSTLSIPRFLPYRRSIPAFGYSAAKIMGEHV